MAIGTAGAGASMHAVTRHQIRDPGEQLVVVPFAVGTLAKPRICCAAGVLACLSCCANGLAKLLSDILSTATARPSRVTRSEAKRLQDGARS